MSKTHKLPPMQKVIDNLYVGSQRAVRLLRTDNSDGIAHIVNCTEQTYDPPEGITVDVLSMPDEAEIDPTIVRRGLDCIHQAVSNGKRTLVHCYAGVSRSRVLVAAYLHLYLGMTPNDAVAKVIRERPVQFGINKTTLKTIFEAIGVTDIATEGAAERAAKTKHLPRYEYMPAFLSQEDATELIANLEKQRGFLLETGQCKGKPSHATVQWGSRQAYLSCVPKPYRVTSSGDVPNFLRALKTRLEEKYNCYFDSIQVNKHFDENSQVASHTDSPPGHICMISLGAERDFLLTLYDYRVFADLRLANGSLLTFFPKDQYLHKHRMPKSKTPCGARYSLIFRYITEAIAKPGAIGKKTHTAKQWKQRNAKRNSEYEAVQAAYRLNGYDGVAECLRRRSWEEQAA